MLIVCPSCASAYRIEAGKVGMDGRSVRCAACRETWFISPADVLAGHEAELVDEVETDPVAEAAWEEASAAVRQATDLPPPKPARTPVRAPVARRRRGPSLSLVCGLALLAALPLVFLARTSVVRLVPQSAALFARIGGPVNVRGIEIRDIVAFSGTSEEGRPPDLVVEGDLVGVGRSDMPVAPLTVEIHDAAGRVLRSFPVAAPRAVLGPAESVRFRGALASPPADGRAVVLRFAKAEPARRAQLASGDH